MGAEYKKYIFEKVRPYTKNIYACDISNNELAHELCKENLIDHFMPLCDNEPEHVCKEVQTYIKKNWY